ncbi:MAG TPA: ketol-acid reductoisomerase [Gammaproteobacteria bacterium]|jgi:ketol-acid reductoisomerase
MQLFYDADIDPKLIRARRVAVLGYGAQGRAQAANLQDSGVALRLGLRPGSKSLPAAAAAGLEVLDPAAAVAWADLAVMLIPDEVQPQVYREIVEPNLSQGGALVFAHGYNIHFKRIQPRADLDVIMVAPNGIGEQVRLQYQAGHGVPGMIAVHQDATGHARALALSYAFAQGHGRAGIIESTFKEETETDLFAEQAVLSGGLTHLIGTAFETLVEAGYAPEIAYFCCLHEIKLMADMIYARGIAGMRESISSTAEFGDYTRGPRVIGPESRAAMRAMLTEIQNGEFAQELAREMESGKPVIKAGRAAARAALLDKVGENLRKGMKQKG